MKNAIMYFRRSFFRIKNNIVAFAADENIKTDMEKCFNTIEKALVRNRIKTVFENLQNVVSFYRPAADKIEDYIKIRMILENVLDELKFEVLREADTQPLIFISHSAVGKDKEYANMMCDFIVGMGIGEKQLVYTSNAKYGVPFGENIYEYLQKSLNDDIFMIILWSNSYLKSIACLCELGAIWVKRGEYVNIYTPDFDHRNTDYLKSPADPNKMGAILNGDNSCRIMLHQLKLVLVEKFKLDKDRAHVAVDIFCDNLQAFEKQGVNFKRKAYDFELPAETKPKITMQDILSNKDDNNTSIHDDIAMSIKRKKGIWS